MTTEEKFQAAVNIIRNLPKDGPYQPSHDMMLKFYGLYKQAVEGQCHEPKPAFYEVVKGYKWRAWSNLGDMMQDQAKNNYVEELKKIIETMAYTENVANFMDILGPFYEFIDVPGKKKINNNTKDLPHDKDLSDSDSNNDILPIINGNGLHQENGCDSLSSDKASQESSPQPPSAIETIDPEVSLAQEMKEAEDGSSSDSDVVVEVTNLESGVVAHKVATNVYSDSDSDEEYSEPAESPDHLAQVDCGEVEGPLSISHTLYPPHSQVSTRINHLDSTLRDPVKVEEQAKDTVTCGGGDKSHPGGLQMTVRQSGQASRYHSGKNTVVPGFICTPGHTISQGSGGSGGAGGGGDGDGRESDVGRDGVKEDVNAQLVVVLRRLQTDMESVLHRLNTLETITITQHHSLCHHCQGGGGGVVAGETGGRGERSWWPFPELSPRSTFFLLLWPIILLGGFKILPLIRFRRRHS